MVFIETPLFSKRVKELLADEDYAKFQQTLANHPDVGDLIQGTGGLRKARVATQGRGKRGSARVIYYHFTAASQIALLMIYAKNEQADLSADQREALRRIVQHWS